MPLYAEPRSLTGSSAADCADVAEQIDRQNDPYGRACRSAPKGVSESSGGLGPVPPDRIVPALRTDGREAHAQRVHRCVS